MSTPDTVGLKKLVNSGLIVKLKKAVDNLNEKEYEMYNPIVHEVVAALLSIMNNGIDYSVYYIMNLENEFCNSIIY